MIKIWKLVCEQNKGAKLAIIGEGTKEFTTKVKYEIKKTDLDRNIDLLGFLNDIDKIKVLKSSKIFVCPSFYESWGIVIVEAMACGIPVIAWNLPVYEGIYGDDVLKVSIGNTNQFAKDILNLIDDKRLRNDMSQKCQEFVKKYDWEKVAEKELELLSLV